MLDLVGSKFGNEVEDIWLAFWALQNSDNLESAVITQPHANYNLSHETEDACSEE